MTTVYQKIRHAIQQSLDSGKRNFIIYPYGEFGLITKNILNDNFGIDEAFLIDNTLSKYNSKIQSLEFCKNLRKEQYTILFTCANPEIKEEVKSKVEEYFSSDNIVEIFHRGGGRRKYNMWQIQLWTIVQPLASGISWSIL